MSNQYAITTEKYYCTRCKKSFWFTFLSNESKLPRCTYCNSVNGIEKDKPESFIDKIKSFF